MSNPQGRTWIQLSEPGSLRFEKVVSKRFDTSGKSLAKYHHRKNRTARAGKPARVFSLPEPDAAARHDAAALHPLSLRRQRAAVRTLCKILSIGRHARTCRCAAWRKCPGRTRPHETRDKVRAPNDRVTRSAARFHSGEHPMTAYLISLALAGVVAIVIWEACA